MISKTKLKSEEQEKITLLQTLLREHYSQNYKHQKKLISNHTEQCRAMISDLNDVLKELSATTTPTLALEECQKQICRWEEELKTTNEKAALYHMSCQEVFSNLQIGIYAPFPEPISLPTQGFQLRDVLHYSYILLNSIIRDQQLYLQQYAVWYNNYGIYQPGCQPPESIVAALCNYNRPQTPENSKTPSPSTDKVKTTAQSAKNVKSNTNRKLDYNDNDTQKDQEKIKADALSGNTYSDNCLELKASKNVLTKTTNSSNLKSKTDEVLGNTLKQFVAKPFTQTVSYSSNNTLEPKLDQITKLAVSASSELKPDEILDNASKLSAETADSSAINNRLVPAKTSADLKSLQTELNLIKTLEEHTELKPADLSKQPQAHTNRQDNIKELPAAKSANINLQPNPSTIRNYGPKYKSSQKTELLHFNQLVEKKLDNATTSITLLNRPKFNSLFTYIKNKIPGRTDDELLLAVKTVRERISKLSGMTRESIVAAVRKELNRANSELRCVICNETFGDSSISTLQCHHK